MTAASVRENLNPSDFVAEVLDQTLQFFLAFYGERYREQVRILSYGLRPMKKIKELRPEGSQKSREIMGLPQDSLIITVGSCATANRLPCTYMMKEQALILMPLDHQGHLVVWLV